MKPVNFCLLLPQKDYDEVSAGLVKREGFVGSLECSVQGEPQRLVQFKFDSVRDMEILTRLYPGQTYHFYQIANSMFGVVARLLCGVDHGHVALNTYDDIWMVEISKDPITTMVSAGVTLKPDQWTFLIDRRTFLIDRLLGQKLLIQFNTKEKIMLAKLVNTLVFTAKPALHTEALSLVKLSGPYYVAGYEFDTEKDVADFTDMCGEHQTVVSVFAGKKENLGSVKSSSLFHKIHVEDDHVTFLSYNNASRNKTATTDGTVGIFSIDLNDEKYLAGLEQALSFITGSQATGKVFDDMASSNMDPKFFNAAAVVTSSSLSGFLNAFSGNVAGMVKLLPGTDTLVFLNIGNLMTSSLPQWALNTPIYISCHGDREYLPGVIKLQGNTEGAHLVSLPTFQSQTSSWQPTSLNVWDIDVDRLVADVKTYVNDNNRPGEGYLFANVRQSQTAPMGYKACRCVGHCMCYSSMSPFPGGVHQPNMLPVQDPLLSQKVSMLEMENTQLKVQLNQALTELIHLKQSMLK
jgi:hypothetical protein